MPRPRVLRGRQAVLGRMPALLKLAGRCALDVSRDDFVAMLAPAAVTRRRPCLVCFPDAAHDAGLFAAVLVWESLVAGVGTGIYTTPDVWGRRCVLAPVGARAQVAALAAAALLREGGSFVHLTYDGREGSYAQAEHDVAEVLPSEPGSRRWTLRRRGVPAYLPLKASFDATVAGIGKHTRFNLRYYRRRAERDLGCTFVPEVTISVEDLLAFNRKTKYAVSDTLAAWRYRALDKLEAPLFAGIRDGDGRWLALAGGRRRGQSTIVDWQMNRADLPAYSLCTVLRSYLIEQEAVLGATRFYIEGGTTHAMQHSFAEEQVAELTMVRQTLRLRLLRWYARHFASGRRHHSEMLIDPELRWHK